jgi:DNA-binding GntR family transcriptional regulator
MPELGPLELDRRSTAEMVASALRARLLAGEFSSGTPMRESGLAPQLGVSRATMREALQHLVHEGLLTYHLHRGMVVTDLSSADVADIYIVRLVIELAAVRSATEPCADLSALADAVEQHGAAVEEHDIPAIVEADMRFHHELVALSGSPRLMSSHGAALGQLRLALNLLDRSKGDLEAQVHEHRRILRHLKRREADHATALLRDHLERSGDKLAQFLEQTD